MFNWCGDSCGLEGNANRSWDFEMLIWRQQLVMTTHNTDYLLKHLTTRLHDAYRQEPGHDYL